MVNETLRFDTESTLKGILKSMHLTQFSLAERAAEAYGGESWTPQKLNGKIKRKTISSEEYMDLMSVAGVRVYYYDVEKQKFFMPARKGALRKVRGTFNKKMYNTDDSFYVCGDVGKDSYEYDCVTELYLDHDNEFFLAFYYESYVGLKDRVRAISNRQAQEYMDLYLEDETIREMIAPLLN